MALNRITDVFSYVNNLIRPLFRNKRYISLYLRAISKQFDDLTSNLYSLLDNRWLDTANGKNLDNIGEIVGEPRRAIKPNENLFKFDLGKGFDEGELFFSPNQGGNTSANLEDEVYRLFIKAKIMINKGSANYRNLYDIVYTLTGASNIDIIDVYPCKVRINLSKEIDQNLSDFIKQKIEQALPIGVKLEGFTYGTFLFNDDGDGVGFDEGILW